MIMESGSFSLTGTEVSFNPMYADKGAFELTGYPATHAYAGEYTITPSSIDFDILLRVDSGAVIWTGFPATHLYPGSFILSGADYWGTELTVLGEQFGIGSGAFVLTGSEAYFNRISPAAGSYALSGELGFKIEFRSAPLGEIVYLCTLTGIPDLELKIKSFQAIKKTGRPTYLQVVVPGLEHETQISARSAGQLKIDMGYRVGGIVTNRSTILETNLEDISVYKGSNKRTITLTGYGVIVYTNNTIRIESPSYKNTLNGYIRYRFPSPNLHVQPGDTVIVDNDTFKANVVTYFVSSAYSSMELSEVM